MKLCCSLEFFYEREIVDIPFLYASCIIFCLVKAPSVFVGTGALVMLVIKNVTNV
jgi:hypothetical protein